MVAEFLMSTSAPPGPVRRNTEVKRSVVAERTVVRTGGPRNGQRGRAWASWSAAPKRAALIRSLFGSPAAHRRKLAQRYLQHPYSGADTLRPSH
jgi:hypothetical protein